MVDLRGKSFLKILDFSAEEILYLVDLAARLKADKKSGCERKMLSDKNIVLLEYFCL